MTTHESAFDRLEQVVAETAAAIRSGDLPAMMDLTERTEAALSELEPGVDPARIAALRDLAGRNAVGLEASAKGIRAARRRLAEVVAARAGMQTYDNVGNTHKIGGPTGAVKARL